MNLHLILGDQLNSTVSSLVGFDKANDIVMLCEVAAETSYVKHHKKKIILILSAMRHFAKALRHHGFTVHFVELDDPDNTGSFSGEIQRAITLFQPEKLIVTEASEYRVLQDMQGWQTSYSIPVEIREDTRFLATKQAFLDWAQGRKQLRMEYFYREMRKQHQILMDADKPVGGNWNYDADNRKPPNANLAIPEPYSVKPDEITQTVIDLVKQRFADHFGEADSFHYAVTRKDALAVLNQFVEQRLIKFGDYQDAMLMDEPWLYHSHLSFYLNCGLLLPKECIEAAEQAYYQHNAPLNAVEGFVRQILGWREYVRGLYWLKMPDYEQENYLAADRSLPSLFWTAESNMRCMQQCISQTKQHAYAHHIQRLMVIGNFSLLTGLSPDEVNEWYLIVYADAFHWVELPNVTGMILFADGGVLASKPYAASGSYINKMSNYCQSCHYNVKEKQGDMACPFNYLYWDFFDRHKDKFGGNPRLSFVYKNLNKMDEQKLQQIRVDSQRFLNALNDKEIV
jgi:deoxyribodipyrimidine photolyase-related protein